MSFDPFTGDEAHPDWAAYVATNLREALRLVPDTGDWHGALAQWCDQAAGEVAPNYTAEQMAELVPHRLRVIASTRKDS